MEVMEGVTWKQDLPFPMFPECSPLQTCTRVASQLTPPKSSPAPGPSSTHLTREPLLISLPSLPLVNEISHSHCLSLQINSNQSGITLS